MPKASAASQASPTAAGRAHGPAAGRSRSLCHQRRRPRRKDRCQGAGYWPQPAPSALPGQRPLCQASSRHARPDSRQHPQPRPWQLLLASPHFDRAGERDSSPLRLRLAPLRGAWAGLRLARACGCGEVRSTAAPLTPSSGSTAGFWLSHRLSVQISTQLLAASIFNHPKYSLGILFAVFIFHKDSVARFM